MHEKEIRAEVLRLLQLQLEALDAATFSFAGLTRPGWVEYGERQARIRALRDQIRKIEQKKASKMRLLKMHASRHVQ